MCNQKKENQSVLNTHSWQNYISAKLLSYILTGAIIFPRQSLHVACHCALLFTAKTKRIKIIITLLNKTIKF